MVYLFSFIHQKSSPPSFKLMFTDIFMAEYKVGKLGTSSILLFNVFIFGSFACLNLVNIFKFASLSEGSVYSIFMTLL